MAIDIVHLPDSQQFRADIDARPAGRLRYRIWPDGTWELYSTVVSNRFRGRGIAGVLTRAAVETVIGSGAALEPSCWYVAEWLERNPEVLERATMPEEDLATNRSYWDAAADRYVAAGERNWQRSDPAWGVFGHREDDLNLLPEDLTGQRTLELGCGTGYVSGWLARRGATAVGVDNSAAQLATARRLATSHAVPVEFVNADAQRLPFAADSFDLAVTEYGAVTWCDPVRWVPEAERVLRPGGRLIVVGGSPWATVATPPDGSAADRALHRPYFGIGRTSWRDAVVDPGGVQHDLTVSQWFALFHGAGFVVERFLELPAPADAPDQPCASAAWARDYPLEQAWVLRLRD